MRSPRNARISRVRKVGEINTIETDPAVCKEARWRRQKPHDRHGGHALAAAGFADQADDLAGSNAERHAFHDRDRAFLGPEPDRDPVNVEKGTDRRTDRLGRCHVKTIRGK